MPSTSNSPPAARGQGIGTAGLSKAIDEAFAHGATRVFVDPNPANTKALALYQRLGFDRIDPPPHVAASWESVDFTPVYMEATHKRWTQMHMPGDNTSEASASTLPPLSKIPRGEYAYPGPLRNALVAAILSGAKTSTTCLFAEFEDGEDPRDALGSLEAVVDSAEHIVCVTRTTDVRIVRLADVAEDHAIAEGEGYSTVTEWRAGHERFWRSKEYVADMGELTLDDDTLVVCYRFAIDPRYPVSSIPHT